MRRLHFEHTSNLCAHLALIDGKVIVEDDVAVFVFMTVSMSMLCGCACVCVFDCVYLHQKLSSHSDCPN